MEKRVIFAAALSILVLVTWSWLFPPPQRPPRASEGTAAAKGEIEATPQDAPEEPTGETAPLSQEAVGPVAARAREEILVEHGLFVVTLTNEGGRCVSFKLRDYTSDGGDPLEVLPQFSGSTPAMLTVDLDDAELAETLNGALYAVKRQPVPAGERVEMTWSDGRGLEARKAFTFHDDGYIVDVQIEVRERGRRLPARLVLGPGFGAQEIQSRSSYYYAGQAVWNHAGGVTRVKKSKLDEPGRFSAEVRWVGFEDQYFAALVLPGAGTSDIAWRTVEVAPLPAAGQAAEPSHEPLLAVSVPEGGLRLFVGPKKFTLLRDLGSDLDRVVWFASNGFLAWIARFIFLCLIWIHDHTVPNYGLAIILSTFLLRLLLFPVNQYSMVSMKKTQLQMQRLQPKVKRIREKYKKTKDAESRGKMNQEMMELYRKEGVNPMGGLNGCLPMLAQFPILIGFYNMLTVAIELRGAPFFGWIHDLSQSDPYWITPLLMGGTMFMQQRMAMSKVTDPVQAQQQRIMMIMPVVFTWICLQMPAGMVLYWFVNNVLGMGQQWLVNRHTSRLEEAAQKA